MPSITVSSVLWMVIVIFSATVFWYYSRKKS